MKSKFLTIFLFLFAFTLSAQNQKFTYRLQEKISNTEADEYIRTLVVFDDQVNVTELDKEFYSRGATIQERTMTLLELLQNKAKATQPEVLDIIKNAQSTDDVFRYQSYWIVNMIMVEAKASALENLATSARVQYIDLDAELAMDVPVEETDLGPNTESLESVEDGVKIINAHKLWEMGITGAGRLVMGIDTGVEYTHPALSHKWRGNTAPLNQSWYSYNGGTGNPTDCDSHGTHTMGTMTGFVPATGDTLGVAIGAEWIAANTLCGGSPHTSYSMAAFQWSLNPDNDSTTTTDMPDAICNSWYDPATVNECSGAWEQTFNVMEAAGVGVVFSAGNSGSSAQTITMPKNINTDEVSVFATGAIDGAVYLGGSNTPIANFSSRGTSTCGGTGSLLIKPEASAPGVSVRSAVLNGGYGTKSGTSMAAPHVTGAIVLLKQAYPNLTGKQIKLALYNTAKDLGTPGEDNDYGTGLIDVFAAFVYLGTSDIVPPTDIVDLSVSEKTSNSLKLTWTAPEDSSAGGVVSYDLRYSTSNIADTNDFNAATVINHGLLPAASGSTENYSVSSLDFGTTYYFAIMSKDVWNNKSNLSNVASAATYVAPVISVTPDSLELILQTASTAVDTVFISNTSVDTSTLDFSISLDNNTFPEGVIKTKIIPVQNITEGITETKGNQFHSNGMSIEGFGGPDAFGYKWIDSDESNGPSYVWNDISTSGTEITTWAPTGTFGAKDEGTSAAIALGFSFKFYGIEYTEVMINSNGPVLFSSATGNLFTNDPIPDAGAPNNFIAGFWDDMDGTNQGAVYTLQNGNEFIIQFNDWPKYNTSSGYTFQVVLKSNGQIYVYYNNMTGVVNSATVGIENAAGTDGLQVDNNASYAANNKALKFAAEPDWVETGLSSGTLFNGLTAAVEVTFNTEDYPAGDYSMDLKVASNDPSTPEVTIPLTMEILVVPVEFTSFEASAGESTVELAWITATETNNSGFAIERNIAETSWEKIGFVEGNGNATIESRYNYSDNLADKVISGTVKYRLKQIDYDGTLSYSNIIEVDAEFVPKKFALEQNYPNPFNPTTTIKYALPEASNVKITLYNVLGEAVRSLVNSTMDEGYHRITLDASDLSSGVYIYAIEATGVNTKSNFYDIKKLILMK